MSEFTWYCRLLVWVGAVILLVESIEGRALGFVTLVGVLALGLGLLAFVAGLALDARPLPAFSAPGSEESDRSVSGPGEKQALAQPQWPPAPERAREQTDERDVIEAVARRPGAAVRARGATAVDVMNDGPLAGAICPSCHERLRPGEVAARCGECGTPQHASCWVGNRFHCAREGCGGEGPLAAAESGEESAGPSTA